MVAAHELDIETPRWAEDLLDPMARHLAAWGGRGSGKSHFYAELLVEEHVADPNQASVCLREVQKSIKMSVKRLIEQKIKKLNVGYYFDVQDSIIKSRNGDGLILFQGMQNHTADSIKSLEDFKRAWFEEAQNASQRSVDLLRPTIRSEGSQMWWSWNPGKPTDPVDKMFRGEDILPPRTKIVRANYMDNPWFPQVLREEMEYDKRRDPDKYAWIWLGEYEKRSKARVFSNWRVEEFETDRSALLRFGADWGFSIDPSVLVRGYVVGRTLYIEYEAYQVGCEIIDLPELFLEVPDVERWPVVADSSRPETISHMKKHGIPKIRRSVKGPGSIQEGIEWLKTYDIVVHPRCVHVIDELSTYSYKVDDVTQEVLPELADKDNHVIDALRYMIEALWRAAKGKPPVGKSLPIANKW